MSVHVEGRPDLTLQAKRSVFKNALEAGRSRFFKNWAANMMRPDHPGLALALGESLVRTPRKVLALTAHPDDLEFFAGGTLRRMALSGSQIHAVVLSDGEKRGNWTDLADQRRREQHHAGRLQGYTTITFMGLPDFGLPEDPRLETAVVRAWDAIRPQLVFAFDPKELIPDMANRDHKALGRTVMDLARKKFCTGTQVYFYGTNHPDVLVDITSVMPDKLRAAKAHQSQMVYLDELETDQAFELLAEISAGNSSCRYAEGLYHLM